MRINGFQCETCKKMHSIPESYGSLNPPRHNLPSEWFTAFRGTGEDAELMNFCSEGCLRRWAQGDSETSSWIEGPRRLLLFLDRNYAEDDTPEYPDEVFLARMSALRFSFTRAFPAAPTLQASARIFPAFSERMFWFSGMREEHERWAKAAKASGLIDNYAVDYDPQGGDK